MPDVEPPRYPSREGRPSQQDQADFQVVCSGRRRTCALLNSPSPYVNNAIHHMQELKMTVENWCQQDGKYQPRIDQTKHQCSKTFRFQPKDTDTESMMSTELFVEGIAISARVLHPVESCPLSSLLKKINDVLGEVVYLIERLEADRQYAEEALHKEKRRKRFLESKVENVSLWKQQEHSFVVQKEHKACARDIAELKWRLKLEKEKRDQVRGKLSDTEVSGQRLREDIDFAKNQIALVTENLDLQRTFINQINSSQAEADEVYSKTQSDLLMSQTELKRMELDASNEKISLDHELLAVKNQLASRLEDLDHLKILEESLCAEIKAAEKTVALTEEKCATMMQRTPEMTEHEKNEKDRILHVKLQIEDEMQKNKTLNEKLRALQEDIERCRLNGEAEVSCIEEQLQSKCDAFASLRRENMESEQRAEDYKTNISESEKVVGQMRTERKQMLRAIADNVERWEAAAEEVTQVAARHSVARTKLDERRQLAFMKAQGAKEELENLRKDLSGRISALELLKGQCAEMKEGLTREKRSSEICNQKLQKDFEDASSATKALETKIEKIKEMTEHFEKVQREHRNTRLNLEREKQLRGDQLKAAQDLHTATIERYDNIQDRISGLMEKCKEYQDAADRMEKAVEGLPEVIAELESVFDVLDFKNKSAALIMSILQTDINNCQRRTQRSMQTHTAHVKARKKEMGETEEALRTALRENKRLAREYQGLKKILVEAKQEAVSASSQKNRAHESFHDQTQLSLLQERMHRALSKHFKRRSLCSRAELGRCQALSRETSRRIKTAQEGLSDEIRLIAAFLRSVTDDSTTADVAGVNKQARPDAAGSNGSFPEDPGREQKVTAPAAPSLFPSKWRVRAVELIWGDQEKDVEWREVLLCPKYQ